MLKYSFFLILFFISLFSQDVLVLNSGAVMKGNLKKVSTNFIQWKSHQQTIKIDFNKIQSISRSKKGVKRLNSNQQFIGLSDGSEIFVDNLAINQDLSFHWNNQDFTFNRRYIRYFSPEFKPSKTVKFLQKGTEITTGFYLSSPAKPLLYSTLSTNIEKNYSFSFSVNFFNEDNEYVSLSFGNFLKLTLKDKLIMFFKDNKLVNYQPLINPKYEIAIEWHSSTRQLNVLVNNDLVHYFKIEEYADIGAIRLRKNKNYRGHIALWNARLNSFQKNYPSIIKEGDYIKFRNNDYIIGNVSNISNSSVSIIEDLGKYDVPSKNIKEIYFGTPFSTRSKSFEVYLWDKQIIHGEAIIDVNAKFLRLENNILGKIKIPFELVKLIVFP